MGTLLLKSSDRIVLSMW